MVWYGTPGVYIVVIHTPQFSPVFVIVAPDHIILPSIIVYKCTIFMHLEMCTQRTTVTCKTLLEMHSYRWSVHPCIYKLFKLELTLCQRAMIKDKHI